MFSFITVSKTSSNVESLRASIGAALTNTYLWELVVVDGTALDLFRGYNRGASQAKYPYLVFVHDDIEFLANARCFDGILHLLEDPFTGVIGVAGSTCLDDAGRGWGCPEQKSRGAVYHPITGTRGIQLNVWPHCAGKFGRVLVLDGLLLACSRRAFDRLRGFDEENYEGFHYYDIDFSFRADLAGLQNYVVPLPLFHGSHGRQGGAWEIARQRFLKLHFSDLPREVPLSNRRSFRSRKKCAGGERRRAVERFDMPRNRSPRIERYSARYQPLHHGSPAESGLDPTIAPRAVAVIVLSYNTRQLTDTLAAYLRNELAYPHKTIYVFDNGSRNPPSMTDYRFPQNLGYTRGFASALDIVRRRRRFDAYWLLNSDVKFDYGNDVLSDMVAVAFADSTIAQVAPQHNSPYAFMDRAPYAVTEVPFLEGTATFVKESTILAIGFWDTRMTLGWGVDYDYGYRVRCAGFRNVVTNRARIRHLGHQSIRNFTQYADRASYEMTVILSRKYGDDWRRKLLPLEAPLNVP